jgi:cell division protease FtsH
LLKVTIVPRGTAALGYAQYTPKEQYLYDIEQLTDQICMTLGGRAAEELVYGVSECTAGAQQDLSQITRNLRVMVLRYAMTRLQELKQQAQQRNLFFLGSDVKQELNNIVDNFTTNFMDIIYNEVLAFLQTIRPGGERLVDQLMISEELTGKDLRTLAREYLSNLTSMEVLYTSRESSLFDFMLPELKKYISEVEKEVETLIVKK